MLKINLKTKINLSLVIASLLLLASTNLAQAGLLSWLGCCKRPSRANCRRLEAGAKEIAVVYAGYAALQNLTKSDCCPAEWVDSRALGIITGVTLIKAGAEWAGGFSDRAAQQKFLLEQAQLASERGLSKWGQDPRHPLTRAQVDAAPAVRQ